MILLLLTAVVNGENNDVEASEPLGEGAVDWNAAVIFDVIGDNDENHIDGSGVLFCQNLEFGSRFGASNSDSRRRFS